MLRDLIGNVVQGLAETRLIAEVATCEAAIESCRYHQPDVVILGWTFSDGEADLILKTLVPELPRTRWLALCAQASGRIVHTAVTHGAQACVTHQAGLSSLRQAIRTLLAGGTYFCSTSSRLLLDAIRQQQGATDPLTERERVILRHYAAGINPKRIGALLNTSPKTVQNQLTTIRQKLGLDNTAALVRYALLAGLD